MITFNKSYFIIALNMISFQFYAGPKLTSIFNKSPSDIAVSVNFDSRQQGETTSHKVEKKPYEYKDVKINDILIIKPNEVKRTYYFLPAAWAPQRELKIDVKGNPVQTYYVSYSQQRDKDPKVPAIQKANKEFKSFNDKEEDIQIIVTNSDISFNKIGKVNNCSSGDKVFKLGDFVKGTAFVGNLDYCKDFCIQKGYEKSYGYIFGPDNPAFKDFFLGKSVITTPVSCCCN